jgi:hypothetical protein
VSEFEFRKEYGEREFLHFACLPVFPLRGNTSGGRRRPSGGVRHGPLRRYNSLKIFRRRRRRVSGGGEISSGGKSRVRCIRGNTVCPGFEVGDPFVRPPRIRSLVTPLYCALLNGHLLCMGTRLYVASGGSPPGEGSEVTI